MNKYKRPVRFTGQHFTIDKVLIADAIEKAELTKKDIVLDIGAGKGFLTLHLAKVCKHVIAIENDIKLLNTLKKKFSGTHNISVIGADLRKYSLPTQNFKLVSNIPYGISSEILKSLMFYHAEHFKGGSLVMQLEAAQKLVSKKQYNPYSLCYHALFDLKLLYDIPPESFMPPPSVRSALLKIVPKNKPYIEIGLRKKYLEFLFFFLKKPEIQVGTALKKLFRKRQVVEISRKNEIKLDIAIVNLSAKQWSVCFNEMLDKVPEKYHP